MEKLDVHTLILTFKGISRAKKLKMKHPKIDFGPKRSRVLPKISSQRRLKGIKNDNYVHNPKGFTLKRLKRLGNMY